MICKTRCEVVSYKASQSIRPQSHTPRDWSLTPPIQPSELLLEVIALSSGGRVCYTKSSREQPAVREYIFSPHEASACQGNTDQSLGLWFHRQPATSGNHLPIGWGIEISPSENGLPRVHQRVSRSVWILKWSQKTDLVPKETYFYQLDMFSSSSLSFSNMQFRHRYH